MPEDAGRDIGALAVRITVGEDEQAARAIQELIYYELGVSSDSVNSVLSLQVRVVQRGVEVKLGGHDVVTISRVTTIDCLRQGRCVLSEIIRLIAPEAVGDEDLSVGALLRQRDSIESAQPRITFLSNDPTPPVAESRLRTLLEKEAITALVGPSSSGKTVTLDALCHGRAQAELDYRWINLSDPRVGSLGLIAALVRLRRSRSGARSLVVMDDLQSAPALGRSILKLWITLRPVADFIVGTWPDAAEILDEFISSAQRAYCDGTAVCRRLLARVSTDPLTRDRLLRLANGDALVAELSADFFVRQSRVPSIAEVARSAHQAIVSDTLLAPIEQNALFEVACLGMFEIDPEIDLLAVHSREGVLKLLQKRILRSRGGYAYLGHRSIARLVVRSFRDDGVQRMSPVRLAVNYLRRAGEQQTKQTLDRLDLVSMAGRDDQFGAAFLAQCWTSVRVLVRQLSQQMREDPTWGDNVSSAVFAGYAFAELGLSDEWRAVANYVRNRWALLDDATLPEPIGSDTTEADDFSEIQRKMIEEDEIVGESFDMRGVDIDVNRFHRTWMLGLLLGFEGKALERDATRLSRLKNVAAAVQLPEGAFYPPRVPWIAARVLLGLAATGESILTSDVLRAGSGWLRSRPPIGPYRFGVWRPGTGTWNTDLQTTAITLLALGRMGIGPADPAVRGGLEFLRAGRAEWYKPGKEIDCAQAIEAALVLGGSWRDFATELQSLLNWAQDSRSWADTRALASQIQDESSKVPAVASSLIGIIWETVRAELPILLQEVAGDNEIDEEMFDPSPWLDIAARRVEELVAVITENVRDREAVVARGKASREVRDLLITWRQRRDSVIALGNGLAELVHAWNPERAKLLRAQVDTLGVETMGEAWEPLWMLECEV